MRVLFIATYSGTSGASYSLVSLIKYLRNKSVNPLVILPNKGPLEGLLIKEKIPYKIIRLFNWVTPIEKYDLRREKIKWLIKKVVNILQEVRIMSLIKKNNIELVHINAVTASWGFHSAKKKGIPIVWHIREFLEEDLNKRFWDSKKSIKCLNRADAVIAISESVKRKYENILNNDSLVRIYNGVDIEVFLRRSDIFKESVTTLTLAGRIVPAKGHEEVVYAVKHLVENGLTNLKVLFVGGEGDRTFALHLKNLIRKLNIEKYFKFTGYRNDMQKVWSETDIALVCSKAEAFGRVTVEAMMAGALVIGADTEGTAELLSNQYGLTYKQGNYLSLAKKVQYAINNKHEMKSIAYRSQIYAKKTFTAEINAQKIYEIYNKVLN